METNHLFASNAYKKPSFWKTRRSLKRGQSYIELCHTIRFDHITGGEIDQHGQARHGKPIKKKFEKPNEKLENSTKMEVKKSNYRIEGEQADGKEVQGTK